MWNKIHGKMFSQYTIEASLPIPNTIHFTITTHNTEWTVKLSFNILSAHQYNIDNFYNFSLSSVFKQFSHIKRDNKKSNKKLNIN